MVDSDNRGSGDRLCWRRVFGSAVMMSFFIYALYAIAGITAIGLSIAAAINPIR